ncbi:hypothetical protein Poly59_61670 [Rubripirellula reticaptiva]|uniref:Uncharacterized protein n=1 Tax=Rubripirellula reticaptiva TaxID=2528013 RepID=A0A5C6E6G5_9BACT|nr:hypothetical protein Poly59_61670 [Rubripirellula reticaptiva]
MQRSRACRVSQMESQLSRPADRRRYPIEMQHQPGHVSTTATALIRHVGNRPFRPPWLRYNPQIVACSSPELAGRNATWDIVTRSFAPATGDWNYKIVFQLATLRGPHEALTAGLRFDLCEGCRVPVWTGTILATEIRPRDPSCWYRTEPFWTERYG